MTRSVFNYRRASSSLLLSSDSFNRTNNATTLGATDGTGSLDPLSWTNVGINNFGITSHQAVAQASSSRAMTVIDLGRSDYDISVTMPVAGSSFNGFVFRYSNFTGPAQYWFFGKSASTYQLAKVNVTTTGVITTAVTPTNGDVIRVVCRGDRIDIFVNGVNLGHTTDTYLNTQTKIGFTSFQTTIIPFDDLFVYAA